MTSGVLALITAAMLAWFGLCNITGEPTAYWSTLDWENVLGGFVSAALLVPSAGFTFTRRLSGAWTLCAQCVLYVVSIFVMNPVLQGTGFGSQLDFVLGFHRSNGVAIGLAAIFGLLTAITAAIAGSVTSRDPARQGQDHPPVVTSPTTRAPYPSPGRPRRAGSRSSLRRRRA